MMRFVLALLAVTGAWGQSLEVTPSAVDRGSANIFRILLKSAAGKELAALQWELMVPVQITIEVSGIVTGDAAEGAGKSLTCAAKRSDEPGRIFACILAGGLKTMPAGAIAIVRYAAAENASPGSALVRVEKAVGISADLKKIAVSSGDGVITIR
jgi:hypothetical protein